MPVSGNFYHLHSQTMSSGKVTATSSVSFPAGSVTRATLEQNALEPFVVPLHELAVWDSATAAKLPSTPAADDLGFIAGTFGTSSDSVQTEDLKAAGATTSYARFRFVLPPEYDDGQSVTVRLYAGMLTTVADTTATIDVVCYKSDKEAGIGSDICATAAQSINSLTLANKDFTITPTGLVAGDVLDIRIATAVNDGATGTAVKAIIGYVAVLCDIRG